MSLKVDGGSASTINKQNVELKKTEVKTAEVKNNVSSPETNAAVYANREQNTQRADLIKSRVSAQLQPTAIQSTPTITPQEAEARANEIIQNNGGRDNLDTEGVGRDLAEIARQNPDDAWAITQAMLGDSVDQNGNGKVREDDKDEIAQSFEQNLSDSDLQTIGQSDSGKELLNRFSDHLTSGRVHGDETDSALRLETAAKGYPPPQLSGNPEQDLETVINDLNNIPPDKRDDYILDVLQNPFGMEALQRAGVLDNDERNLLAGALDGAYDQNPSLVSGVLNESLDNPIGGYGWEQTGLADVVSRTGNDAMIAGYAKHAMNIANSGNFDPSSLCALTALGGMSPEGLQNFINFGSANPPQYGSPSTMGRYIQQNRDNFFNLLNGAVDNYQPWISGPAIGGLLDAASQMTGADGKLASDAIEIFSAIAPKFKDEVYADGAVSEFFINHSDQILESLLQTDQGQAVLQQYFENTLFSTETSPEVRTKIEDALSDYVGDQVANAGTNSPLVGDKIGELFGTIQAAGRDALAEASGAEKDQIREFTVGVLGKVTGALVGKGITAMGTAIGGPVGTGVGIAASAIFGQILGNVFKTSDPDPAVLAQQFIDDLEAAGGDVNLGENLLEELNDKFNQVLADLNAEIATNTDPEVVADLNEIRTQMEQLLRAMNDSYQIRLNN